MFIFRSKKSFSNVSDKDTIKQYMLFLLHLYFNPLNPLNFLISNKKWKNYFIFNFLYKLTLNILIDLEIILYQNLCLLWFETGTS